MSGEVTISRSARGKLYGLQGLRALAFMGIFVSHAGIGAFGCLGAWGVSVFIVLSGFLMAYNYLRKDSSPRAGLRFAWSKVWRLYPLHIVMMLGCVVIALWNVRQGEYALQKLGLDVLLQACMILVWIPLQSFYAILNGPSWFMAVSVFTYALFPLALKWLHAIRGDHQGWAILAALFAVQIGLALLAQLLGAESKQDLFSMQWIVYYFPPSRFVDFAMGAVVGWLFLRRDVKGEEGSVNLALVGTFAVVALCLWAYAADIPVLGAESVKYTLLFTPTSLLLVWLIARSENRGGSSQQMGRVAR